MSDVTLSPSDPLLRHRLERYAETLEARGLDVDLARRGGRPDNIGPVVAISD